MIADCIIHAAADNDILLEENEASKKEKHHYWSEFWAKVEAAQVIHGLDAHSLQEIRIIQGSSGK